MLLITKRAAVAMPCCGWDTNGRYSLIRSGLRVIESLHAAFFAFVHSLSSVHGGSGWKVDKSGPCGNQLSYSFRCYIVLKLC